LAIGLQNAPALKLRWATQRACYCNGFEFASERGQRRDDLRPSLRVVGFEQRVAIVFAVSDSEVTILRLYYGGQNWSPS
jgi:toxin ParE1/3/4